VVIKTYLRKYKLKTINPIDPRPSFKELCNSFVKCVSSMKEVFEVFGLEVQALNKFAYFILECVRFEKLVGKYHVAGVPIDGKKLDFTFYHIPESKLKDYVFLVISGDKNVYAAKYKEFAMWVGMNKWREDENA